MNKNKKLKNHDSTSLALLWKCPSCCPGISHKVKIRIMQVSLYLFLAALRCSDPLSNQVMNYRTFMCAQKCSLYM